MSNLPEGWRAVPIRRLYDCWGGMTPSTANSSYWGGAIPWISSKDVKTTRIAQGTEFITSKALAETRLKICPPGSVLMVVRSGVLAHSLPVSIVDGPVVVNQDIKVFDSGNDRLNEWLALYFRAHSKEILDANRKDGTTVQSIRVDDLLDNEVPVPPVPEQERIVAKIEALLTEVSAARARLEKVPVILRRFRQAVLAAACSGRLTEEWRAHHPKIKGAAQILAECKQQKEGQGPRKRATTGIAEVDLPPDLPSSWIFRRVRELAEDGAIIDYQDGNHGSLYPRSEDFGAEGVTFITAKQVFDGKVFFNQAPRLRASKARELRIGFSKPHDVLLTHNATVGRVAILPFEAGDCLLGTSVTYYRLAEGVIDSTYCMLFMQSKLWQDQLRLVMEQTTRNQVSVKKQAEFWIIVPPFPEQLEIARRVHEMLQIVESVEAKYDAVMRRLEELARSIFSRAFRGELVPTEAELARSERRDFESAEQLLARVQLKREAEEPLKVGRSRKSKKPVAEQPEKPKRRAAG